MILYEKMIGLSGFLFIETSCCSTLGRDCGTKRTNGTNVKNVL